MLTEQEKETFLQRTYADPLLFCEQVLPNIFPGEMPWFHRGLLAYFTGRTRFLNRYGQVSKIIRNYEPLFTPLVDGELLTDDHLIEEAAAEDRLKIQVNRKRYCGMTIPRGSGKTSVVGVAVPLYKILFHEVRFLVYVSETKDHSKMQLDNVRRELSSNEIILNVWGDLKPELRDDERWASDAIETLTGTLVVARGRGSQIRGLNHRGNRPDLFILDDVEDRESVSTELQRQKTKQWAYGDLLPASQEIKGTGELVALGTLLDDDSLLKTFERDPQFTSIKFSAYDKDGDLLWPAWMDEQKLKTKHESYALAGELRTFHLEYFSESIPPELQIFNKGMFQYLPAAPTVVRVIYGDPAISKNKRADEATIYVVGVTDRGRFELIDCFGKRGCAVREYINTYFHMAKIHKVQKHGIESNGYQMALVELFREVMFQKGYFFEPIPVTNKQNKQIRIQGVLQPRFASMNINLRNYRPALEGQLLMFDPNQTSQRDDHADALAGAIMLLDASAGQQFTSVNTRPAKPLENWRWAP